MSKVPARDRAPESTEPADEAFTDIEERRGALMVVATEGIKPLLESCELVDVLDHVLRAIATELLATSMQLEEETAPAMVVLGQLVGGLFGSGTTATDEEMLGLYQVGERLRDRIGASA